MRMPAPGAFQYKDPAPGLGIERAGNPANRSAVLAFESAFEPAFGWPPSTEGA